MDNLLLTIRDENNHHIHYKNSIIIIIIALSSPSNQRVLIDNATRREIQLKTRN